ncbi:MAG TPA: metalloregulator ArsR/SmtB family transcription factor [Spirochaetia bacterium]|nr:metalloregulator ArsR/SmtB family transcription factor [Spirochaetia bacterium]
MPSLVADRAKAVHLADTLKSLAHPIRLRIVGLLCAEDLSVTVMAERLDVPQAIVSQQLRILRMSGLVQSVRTGGRASYRLGEPRLRQLVKCLEGCPSKRIQGGSG